MKKIILLSLMLLMAATAFGDQTIRDGKGRKVRLMSNYTYSVMYDGEIVRDSNGRKILLKDNHTWEYFSDVTISDILEDESGKKIWLKSNGTWGYMRRNEDREYKFRNVAIESVGRKSRISGRVLNDSSKDFESATFKLVIFDTKNYEYRTAGTITIEDFNSGEEGEFEVTLYANSDDIASYYFEFIEGVERRVVKERVIKKKRPKAMFEFKMDIQN